MYTKVIFLAAALTAVCAQHKDYGNAYSSQSIVFHQSGLQAPNNEEKNEEALPPPVKPHFTPADDHIIPVVEPVAPVAHVPVVHHAIPVVHHVAPVVHHVTPIVVAPVTHHVVPVVHKPEPVVYKSTPAEHKEEEHIEYYGHPKYEFAYSVEDKHTGDIKSQHESRDGHLVKGEYSLHQPDGAIRTVKYSADKNTGFNADVHYSGHSQHAEPKYHH